MVVREEYSEGLRCRVYREGKSAGFAPFDKDGDDDGGDDDNARPTLPKWRRHGKFLVHKSFHPHAPLRSLRTIIRP